MVIFIFTQVKLALERKKRKSPVGLKNLLHLSKSQTFKPFCLDTKFKFDLHGNILPKEKFTALQHFLDKTIQQNLEEKQYIVRVSILNIISRKV